MPTKDKKFKKDFDTGFGSLERITFMSDLLSKQNEIRNTLDMRSSIIIGFESAAIAVLFTLFEKNLFSSFPIIIGLISIITSLILAIIALKPPSSYTKQNQKESIFYHHYIDSLKLDDFQKQVHETLQNEESIYNAYIQETYNLTCFSNIPRKLFLYLSIRVIIYGLIVAVITFILQALMGY